MVAWARSATQGGGSRRAMLAFLKRSLPNTTWMSVPSLAAKRGDSSHELDRYHSIRTVDVLRQASPGSPLGGPKICWNWIYLWCRQYERRSNSRACYQQARFG